MQKILKLIKIIFRELCEKLKPNFFLKFCLVGSFGFLFDLSFFNLFYFLFKLNIFLSRALSFIFAVNFTWYLNRKFTYSVMAKFKFKEWVQYILGVSVGSLINYSVFVFLVNNWTLAFYCPSIAIAFGALSGLFFNFNMSKVIFKEKYIKSIRF